MTLRILLVGRIQGGEFSWDVNVPPPVEDEPVDGEIQRLLDEAADTEDYEQDILDREWHSRGEW